MANVATASGSPVASAYAGPAFPGDARPLIMHVVYRFAVGGLENGIVNLLNRLPADDFRHAIVALTDCDPEFCRRVERDDVEYISLHKPPGNGWKLFARMWKLIRAHRPAILHTRNLAALEMQLPAWAAGVPVRVHGEHGRDVSDPDGTSRKYRIVRRAYSRFVTHYVTVSADLERYLKEDVHISWRKVLQVYNGVDAHKFRPSRVEPAAPIDGKQEGLEMSGDSARAATPPRPVVFGCVGRLQEIKGHQVLIDAVARLRARMSRSPAPRFRVRLVGDGPLRPVLEDAIKRHGLGDVVELEGQRNDVAVAMREFDVFVLPSLGEGISNTLLEAMASGLPVVATAVGGNTELVANGETGTLVPAGDPVSLANALAMYLDDAELRQRHGTEGRAVVERRFDLSRMVERYSALYREALIAYAPHRLSARG